MADGLITQLPSRSKRGARYEITPKGREAVLQEQDHKFIDETPFFRAFDLSHDVNVPANLDIPASGVVRVRTELELPEEIVRDQYSVFPFPIRTVLRMSENATYAIEPWLRRMRGKYGIRENYDEEWLYEEVANHFADPTTKKLCEVLFERTRVLCSLHSTGEKNSLPTMDNVLNFSFEFICRYEGESLVNVASKEQRIRAQHTLAGIILLYLAGSGGGPIEQFVWTKPDLEALVESKLLTADEIQPLLETCKLVNFSFPPRKGDSAELVHENSLTNQQKKSITMSAYKRFYLAGLFNSSKGFPRVSWEDRLDLLPVAKIAQEIDTLSRLRRIRGEKHYEKEPFPRDTLIEQCSRKLNLPPEKLEPLIDRLVELKVIKVVQNDPVAYYYDIRESFLA